MLIFNGDILTGLDIEALVDTHRTTGADVSLHLTRVEDPRAFGLVPTDETGRVTAFLEKPQTPEEIVTDQINAGAYVFNRSIIDSIPEGLARLGRARDLPRAAGVRRPSAGHGRLHLLARPRHPAGLRPRLGRPRHGPRPSPAVPGRCGDRLVLDTAEVAPDAKLMGGTVIGAGARVEPGARIDGSTVLDGAVVESGARIRDSLIGAGARIGARTVLDGAVIGDGAHIGPDNELCAGGPASGAAPASPQSAIRFSSDQ
ncbi:hypothetical protein GCM10020000_49350 [Streptomyces olivoverticillatus]